MENICYAEIEMLKVDDVRKIMKIGKNKVYELVNSKEFPAIRIGNTIWIPKAEFEKWVKKYTYKDYVI